MATLHSALAGLAPLNFDECPSDPAELDQFMSGLFDNSETVLESVPIGALEDSPARPRSATTSSIASSSSEMSSSSARSAPPSPEHVALQKEWGKPLKINAKDNPLNIQVYKCSGKDSRGAWFARRSVHEGLGFARFKRGLEREFPETMKVQGGPGEGNIRGIGGEKCVHDMEVPGKGRVQVYYLSAQFPGPTTPRDFVTFLVTSAKAMKNTQHGDVPELAPRHYMVISKPCLHPDCPPKDGMVRGQYESVEFIREVPRKPKKFMSSHDLPTVDRTMNGRRSPDLERDAVLRSAGLASKLGTQHENRSAEDVTRHDYRASLDPAREPSRSPSGRRRGATVAAPDSPHDSTRQRHQEEADQYDPEANPVEWIMITRSDPGGGIPRFMVERGTPSSIVADAYKFLNWATQQDLPGQVDNIPKPLMPTDRRVSFQSIQANGTLAGINEHEDEGTEPFPSASDTSDSEVSMNQSGILGALSTTMQAYAPQVVLDRLPGSNLKLHTESFPPTSTDSMLDKDDDSESTISATSFASADSHFDGEDEFSLSSTRSPGGEGLSKAQSPHEKELQKLAERRALLDQKLAATREKLAKDQDNQTAKEKEAIKKAEEKHEREMKKQEEKYKKEVAKLQQKKEKEAKKTEERRRRQEDKDEKAKLTRERDEAREEIEVLKKERDIWQKQVGDLQRENTRLIARVGKQEGMDGTAIKQLIDEDKHVSGRKRGATLEALGISRTPVGGRTPLGDRSRSSSMLRRTPPEKDDKSSSNS